MNIIDQNPNFVVKAMVNGAVRAFGVRADSPRLAKKHCIFVLRARGVRGWIAVRSVTPRGNPHLTQRILRRHG